MNLLKRIANVSLWALLVTLMAACSSDEGDDPTTTDPDSGSGSTDFLEALFVPTWDDEYYEYESPEGTLRVDIVEDFDAPTDGVSNATSAFQAAMDYVSGLGGGEVYIPYGTFRFKQVYFKSNVTVLVEAGATLSPMYPDDPDSSTVTQVFYFYGTNDDGTPINNIQMLGLNGRFNVVLEERSGNTLGAKMFLFAAIEDFRVSNVNITDVDTTYPMFTFNTTSQGFVGSDGKDMMGAKNGIISHARVDNCHYGYGLVQAQSASNIHFEKLSGVGGTTLRCETGAQEMNNTQWGGLYNITGYQIYCKNGNSSVMVSPHSMQNGDVSVEHIISESCCFGVRLDAGYISDKNDEGLVFASGTYQNVSIKEVYARFGWEAQIKSKHISYMPTSLLEYVAPYVSNVSEPSPSMAAVVQSMVVGEDVTSLVVEDVIAIDFLTPAIMTCSWDDYVAGNY